MKKILCFSVLLFSWACSTPQKPPLKAPAFSKISSIKSSNIDNLQKSSAEALAKKSFLARNALTKGNYEEACSIWDDLQDISEFPLNDLMSLFILENCPINKSLFKKILNKNIEKKFYKEDFLKIAIKYGRELKLDEELAQLLFEYSEYIKSNSEKIKFLEEALSIARKNSKDDKDEINQKIIGKLIKIKPSTYATLTNENAFAIAKDYESRREFEKAQLLYLEIIKNSSELDLQAKAYNAYRMSFKVNRDLKTFLEKTKEMEIFFNQLSKSNPDDKKIQEIWNESAINLSRALWTEHQNKEADEVLTQILEKKTCNANQCSQTTFIKAQMALEEKSYTQALMHLKSALKYNIKDQNLKENIQWNLIFNSYLAKKYKDVIKLAPKFYSNQVNPHFTSKLKYWEGKAWQKLDKNSEANKIFQELLDSDAFNYYGILSSMELGVSLSSIPNFIPPLTESGDNILDWLIVIDEKKHAQSYLKTIDHKFKTFNERERAYQYYHHTNWYLGSMRQINFFSGPKKIELTNRYAHLIFPYPYLDQAKKISEAFNVPIEYVFSIIRQESSFIPTERSWADAFGLMQLTPESAKKISIEHQIPYQNFEELYLPDKNIELGVALLKSLREKFNKSFIHSTAAYNASEDAIKKWQQERFNGDYFEFIELIPYEETRNYIKLVFRNYITYKRILNNEPFTLKKDFFEKEFN